MRKLASWCFQHRKLVLAIWVGLLLAAGFGGGALGSAFDGGMEIPESESRDGIDAIEEYFGGSNADTLGQIVFHSDAGYDDPTVRAAMEAYLSEANAAEGIDVFSPYVPTDASPEQAARAAAQVSKDGKTAYAAITGSQDLDQTGAAVIGSDLLESRPKMTGLQVEIGGAMFAPFEAPQSEAIGVAFAIVILVVAFGSVVAMGLPIGVALFGVGIGASLISVLSNIISVPDFATQIGAMIGLGVGIDYALFIVTRYREQLRAGHTPAESVEIALDTSGRAVIFAGLTVVLSLLGMLLIGLSFISGLGLGASVTVAATMAASVTLLPALLGFVGERIEVTRYRGLIIAGAFSIALLLIGLGAPPIVMVLPLVSLLVVFIPPARKELPPRKVKPMRETTAFKWSRLVQTHPWLSVAVGAGLLLVIAAPVLGLRLGWSDEGNFPEETTTRKAYDLLADGFGPGFNGPLALPVVIGDTDPADTASALGRLADAVRGDEGVAAVVGPIPSDFANPTESPAYMLQIFPTSSPQDIETDQLIERLRSDVVPGALSGTSLDANVTGYTAVGLDFTKYLETRIPLFFGVVLLLSFLLLMVVFRSLLVPLKAVVMNMLSIAAAYGVVVAIFQWGWFGSLLGISGAPIEPFIPMMMFAIVFGLSMDYEVFLLSRVKEEYDRTGDPVHSVADGLASTATVITAAAAIMVVVFGAFVLEDQRIPKLFGVGLAVAVFLDATLVRMLLVPATMELLGSRNWWLPGWLDRLLPNISVEGPAVDDGGHGHSDAPAVAD